jgi:hypothetical protein
MDENELVIVAETRRRLTTGEARRIRLDRGVRVVEAAAAAGVTPGTLGRWEAGLRNPRAPEALRYGRVLDALAGIAELG